MSLVQRGGVGDALAALLHREGVDEQMRWADEALFHGGRCLDGDQLIHQLCIETLAELGQGLGQHKVRLGAIGLHLTESTGIHHRHIGAQALTHVFIGGAQFVFEQLQGQQHTERHRGPTTLGALFGKAPGKVLLHGLHHSVPRKGIRPQADGMGLRDELGGQELRTVSDQPMLQLTQETHGWLSSR